MILINSGSVAASADEQTRPISAGLGLDSHSTVELAEAKQAGFTELDGLKTFLDEFFNKNMEELNIPGAAVVVVKDGEILFSEGYGFADLEQQSVRFNRAKAYVERIWQAVIRVTV